MNRGRDYSDATVLVVATLAVAILVRSCNSAEVEQVQTHAECVKVAPEPCACYTDIGTAKRCFEVSHGN